MKPLEGARSFSERILGGALLLLAAALAIFVAVKLLVAVLWFLLGMGGAMLLIALAWLLWRRTQRGG